MNDDPYAERRRLTFEQAEGVEPLPRQLQTKELSAELRAVLWQTVYESLCSCRGGYADVLIAPWDQILSDEWVFRRHRMVDEYNIVFMWNLDYLKSIFDKGDYLEVLGFLQFVLRHKLCLRGFPDAIEQALRYGRAAYRVLDNCTIVPIASENERETLERAFADLQKEEFHGARSHLRSAASNLTNGEYAASIRESIHSVESVVTCISNSGDLKQALNGLEQTQVIHGALKKGFLSIYGYISNEKGIRHALLDDPQAKVDEADALFMIGACAAFVSYLINKARSAGLLDREKVDDVAKRVDDRDKPGQARTSPDVTKNRRTGFRGAP